MRSRGLDLSGYSSSFVSRSIKKRLGRLGVVDTRHYVKTLIQSEQETDALVKVLSINVTEFFRDEGAFEAFQKKVLLPLLATKLAGSSGILRIWSAGCATGQEAYTIAICLAEELRQMNVDKLPLISILGTDLSVDAIRRAKGGMYAKEELRNVPDSILKRHFVKVGDKFVVAESVKKFTRFVNANLLEKPTLTCFDAIVCRNVMIYFSREMHEVVIANLYNALRLDGYLMIGRTEALMGSIRGKFDVVDHENRILKKKR
ncbi:MAG TPA: protein-glutamate O-methyltransferase CheR [Thermoplasmata archaeon]|nr:protein-glutamate O-methyltransferase CheR [Thermoplasmata archaeon]